MKTHSPDELVKLAKEVIDAERLADVPRIDIDVLCSGILRLVGMVDDAGKKAARLERERDEWMGHAERMRSNYASVAVQCDDIERERDEANARADSYLAHSPLTTVTIERDRLRDEVDRLERERDEARDEAVEWRGVARTMEGQGARTYLSEDEQRLPWEPTGATVEALETALTPTGDTDGSV